MSSAISDNATAVTTRPDPTITEIVIEGPVTAGDRIYAFDVIDSIFRGTSCVEHLRANVSKHPRPTGDELATADCILIMAGTRMVCAGAVAATVREAVDGLRARLDRHLEAIDGVHEVHDDTFARQ